MTTDEHIETIRGMIVQMQRGRYATPEERAALSSVLRDFHEMRELLEAAGRIELNGDGVDDLGTLERDWDEDSNFWIFEILGQRFRHDKKERFDSALDAWREVKKEQL